MEKLDIHQKVGALVAERPARSRVFERHGIDYCCGGKRTVEEACRERDLDARAVLGELEAIETGNIAALANPTEMTMTELVNHVERTHHEFLRRELPRISRLIQKVIAAHGDKHPWLDAVRSTYAGLVAELEPHMMKEEQILFPMIRELDRAVDSGSFHCGGINNPIAVMEREHENAGRALQRLRKLTSDFAAPEGACNTFRAMLDGLETLEADTHEHIHKENNVLFVRALETEPASRS